MDYKKKFEGGYVPALYNSKIKWEKAISTRIKITPIPFEKTKNFHKWKIKNEHTEATDCKVYTLDCSNGGYAELFIFPKMIYENHHKFPKDWDSNYFLEFYHEIYKISEKLKILNYYCGDVRDKSGLYKIYNKTFEWWDGEIWNTNIDHYRYICKIKKP